MLILEYLNFYFKGVPGSTLVQESWGFVAVEYKMIIVQMIPLT